MKVYLPMVMGEIVSCNLEPVAVWGGFASYFDRFLAQQSSAQKTCMIVASSPGLSLFAQTSYVIALTFYNAPIAFRGEEHAWQLELHSPASSALTFSIAAPFDVVSAFPLFQLRLSRLAVSELMTVDQKGLARIDFQVAGEPDQVGPDGPALCVRLTPPEGFSFGVWCDSFQVLLGLPLATTCEIRSRVATLKLPTALPAEPLAFSLGLWNPPSRLALDQHAATWAIESRHGDCGRLHGQRLGQTSTFGPWPQALYPLPLQITRLSASSLMLSSEASVTFYFVLPVAVQSGASLVVSAPYPWLSENVETSSSATSAASWTLDSQALTEHATELLLQVSSTLQSLTTYGFVASVLHPSVELVDASAEDPRWWSLEIFTGVPSKGYRETPGTIPFEQRIAAGTVPGYSLRRMRDCEVVPWDNRIGESTPVLLRFMTTSAMDAVVATWLHSVWPSNTNTLKQFSIRLLQSLWTKPPRLDFLKRGWFEQPRSPQKVADS